MKRNSFLLACLFSVSLWAVNSPWEQVMEQKALEGPPAIQARVVEKSGRFQISGPAIGTSERRDLYHNYFGALGARYFFNETHGWEIGRVVLNAAVPAGILEDIRTRTSYATDTQPSGLSISSSYIFAPVYGKYAWFDKSIVHFDLYALGGLGLRFATREKQLFGELGVGMSHYFTSRFAVAPEIRWRLYQETRMESVLISEMSFQLGVSWLL